MNTYLLSIILFFFILIVLIKYLNIKIDNFSNKNKNNNKLNILVHKSIQLSKIETLITLCKLKYGDKCNVCINKNNKNNKCNSRINLIYDNTNTKINDFDSYIIIYNKSNIDLKKDSFYNKYIKNKTNNNKRLIINYNSSYTIDKYIDSILMFIKKINIL
jgi:hypothetical protein